MRAAIGREDITPREREEMDYEREMFNKQSIHAQTMRQLDLELAKEEAKWASWLRLPMLLITLPVRIIMAFAYIVAMIRKHDPGQTFWDYMNGRH